MSTDEGVSDLKVSEETVGKKRKKGGSPFRARTASNSSIPANVGSLSGAMMFEGCYKLLARRQQHVAWERCPIDGEHSPSEGERSPIEAMHPLISREHSPIAGVHRIIVPEQ